MPWDIREKDGKFCVVKSDDGEEVACHPTRKEAEDQRAALYASERSVPVGAEYVVRALPEIGVEPSSGDGSLANIYGYAALFGQSARIDSVKEGQFYERMRAGSFTNAIEADKDRYRLLFDHGMHPQNGRVPLGPFTELAEDQRGFKYRGKLLDTEFNRTILPGLKEGLYGSSFLGKIHYGDPVYPSRASDDNPEMWPEMEGLKVRPLMDVGPTPFPIYLGTVTSARSLTDEFLMRHFTEGDGLQKLAAWAKDQAAHKITMPVKEPADVTLRSDGGTITTTTTTNVTGVGGNDSSGDNPPDTTPAKPAQDAPVAGRSTDADRKEPEMGADIDRFTSLESLSERADEIRKRVGYLRDEYSGRAFTTEATTEWDELNEEFDAITARITDLKNREARASAILDGPATPTTPPRGGGSEPVVPPGGYRPEGGAVQHRSRIPENIYDLAAYDQNARSRDDRDQLMVDGAMRAIETETFVHPDYSTDELRENVAKLMENVRGGSEEESGKGAMARHMLATGSQMYRRAFGRYLALGDTAGLDPQESAALFQGRALSLTGASGGFAVPFELDPTILGTSNGTINFVRQVARVVNITVDEWRGITSAGITASFGTEAAETTDNAPTLVQPTVSTEKAQAFVPFSIEVGMDWDGLQAEMTRALGEAKDELEAAKFISGTGTNEPFGILTGTTNTVAAAAGQTFTLANLYALLASLPPRYRSRGTFMGNLLVANRIRQFDTAGGAALWVTLGEDAPDRLLGRPWYEASDMADVATSVKFLLFADFSRYLIADRIGLSVEVMPHLVGTNHRPTGQRGLYAFWRVGAKLLDANASRALLGTA